MAQVLCGWRVKTVQCLMMKAMHEMRSICYHVILELRMPIVRVQVAARIHLQGIASLALLHDHKGPLRQAASS